MASEARRRWRPAWPPFDRGRFAACSGSLVAAELTRQLAKSKGGAAVCAYHRGQKVVDIWGGVRDEGGAPWQRDTMAVSYSTTKGVISTALHILADRGRWPGPARPRPARSGSDRWRGTRTA